MQNQPRIRLHALHRPLKFRAAGRCLCKVHRGAARHGTEDAAGGGCVRRRTFAVSAALRKQGWAVLRRGRRAKPPTEPGSASP